MSLSLCKIQMKVGCRCLTVGDAEVSLWDDYKTYFLSLFINNGSHNINTDAICL